MGDTDDIDFHRWPPEPRGGQQVRPSTGVIVVHRATGLAVVCESERSLHANRTKATERLLEMLTAPSIDSLSALKEALEYATFPLPPELSSREDLDERTAKIDALWRRWFGRTPDES